MPDPVTAAMAILAADSDILALTGGRVFGGLLPESEQPNMPRAGVVVREAGGGLIGTAWENFIDVRLDMFAYGATVREAFEVSRAVHAAMKNLTRTTTANGAVVHWAKQDGGPFQALDPDTTWPSVFSSWQVLVSEVAAA